MIKYSELENVFAEVGLTIHEYNVELEEDFEIELPFIVYTATDGNSFDADGINYFRMLSIGIAMLDETLNFELQRKIEDLFDKYFTPYDKQINFDSEQRIYSISYTITVQDDSIN